MTEYRAVRRASLPAEPGPRGRVRPPAAADPAPLTDRASPRARTPTSTSSSSPGSSSTGHSSSRARRSRAGRPRSTAWSRRGRYYDVWQRPDTYRADPRAPPLGRRRPAGRGPVLQRSLAARLPSRAVGPAGRSAARPGASSSALAVAAATRRPGRRLRRPRLYPRKSAGALRPCSRCRAAGRYGFWLGGSFRDRVRLYRRRHRGRGRARPAEPTG